MKGLTDGAGGDAGVGRDAAAAEAMPRGIANAYAFQAFNATSWSVILGTPMLLYLRGLGASGTVLGIAVALIPLFSALQIPAAAIAERTGYKSFVVRGWGSRSTFILGIALVTLLPVPLGPGSRIAVLLALLACFAAVRGISICGYLPWITGLVPESMRGVFLARDNMCMYLAVTGTMVLSSIWIGLFSSTVGFGTLFLFSYACAIAAVLFLRRVPDLPSAPPGSKSARPPWREMLRFPPFARFVAYSVFFNVFVAALNVVWVPMMRDHFQAPANLVLWVSAYASVISAGAALMAGVMTDRFGSRPLMGFATGLIMIGQGLWMAMAAGAVPRVATMMFVIATFGSTGFAVFGVASTRLLMGMVPAAGRSHFFAIAGVANSLTMGLMPVLWGMLFDGLERVVGEGAPLAANWSWNRYALIYAVAVSGMAGSTFLGRRIREPKAASTEEFVRMIFLQMPARMVARAFMPLFRFPPQG